MERGIECDVWLWEGATEYEGCLVACEEGRFTAHVREVRKGGPSGGALGRRLTASTLDLQRHFAGRKFLAHFKGSVAGTLFEAEVMSVQRSSDGDYDYLLSGGYRALDESQRELLARLSIEDAAALFQRHVG
jgi:hypothetical protein